MNENAKKWVKALRSGEYRQAVGTLSQNGRYCCLGVACDIYERETGDILPRVPNGDYPLEGLYHSEKYGDAFRKVGLWLGLRSGEGGFREFIDDCDHLSALNDNGASFSRIADVIEREPPGLFGEPMDDEVVP